MGKNAQIKQLIEAVQRHPGSPAFALLAEHYLEQGKTGDALQVCQEGFSANPGYERGAVVYLTALRRKGDSRTAGEVFGKAVAYLPRSSRLRLQWAMLLAEAGRDQEARRFAREALNLDPLNREARAMIATLGEAATPLGGTKEYVSPQADPTADLEHEIDQLFDDSDKDKHGTDHGEEIEEEIEEIEEIEEDGLSRQARSQRAAAIRPRIRPIGQRTTPHALFDLTPGPLMEDSRHASPRALHGSPFDITPMPLPQKPSDSPQPEVVIPATEDPSQAPPPAEEPTEELSPIVTAEELRSSIPQRPAGARGTQLLADLPRRRHRWLWITVALVLLAGGAGGGYLFYRRVQDRRIAEAVARALEATRPDLLPGYHSAKKMLSDQLRQHPDDFRVRAGMALVSAHLLARFGGDRSLQAQSRQLLARPGTDPRARTLALVAAALLALADGQVAQARQHLSRTTAGSDNWQLLLARMLCEEPGQRLSLAERVVQGRTEPALLLEAATLLRWSRQLDRSRQAIAKGLKASPSHPGLRIQQALLDLDSGQSVPEGTVAELRRAAGAIPRYRIGVALLQARILEARGQRAEAARAAEQALQPAPRDPEGGMTLARLLLGPGGDTSRALGLLEHHAAVMSGFDPLAPVWLVQALLAMGRPHEARALLGELSPGKDPRAPRVEELRVRCAHLSDDMEGLKQVCSRPAGFRARLACIEAELERLNLAHTDQLMRGITGHRQAMTYINGLRALVQGDTGSAVKLLSRVDGKDLPDPVAPSLALAAAHTRQAESRAAVEILRKAVTRDASSVRSRLALATALVAAGHDSEAQALLEEVLYAKPTQPSVLAHAGQAFLSLGLSSKALKLIQHGIKYNPASAPIQVLAGRVAAANQRWPEARAMFAKVLKQEPNNPEALVELGRLEAAAGERARARKHFARALELRPRDPDLLLLLSRVQAQSGDFRGALTQGMKAIRLLRETNQTHRSNEALVELGRNLRQKDRWAQARAEELLFEATKAKGAPVSAFLELGLLYQARHDQNRAIWCFRQVIDRDATYADGYLRLGLALMRKPRLKAKARKALRQYLKLRPRGQESTRVKGLLKRMR